MNKQKIKQLAEQKPEQKPEPAKKIEPKPAPVVQKTGAPDPTKSFFARLYVALVGSSDFLHTQLGTAEVCRVAYERAEIAVRVWQREQAKAAEKGA